MASINRTLSFFSTWLAGVVRQPWLMFSLVIGPFAILLAFGQGVRVGVPRPRTMLVEAPQPGSPIPPLPDDLSEHLNIVGQTTSVDGARRALADGRVDLIAVAPQQPLEMVRSGKQAPILIITSEIDPVLRGYARTFLREQVDVL